MFSKSPSECEAALARRGTTVAATGPWGAGLVRALLGKSSVECPQVQCSSGSCECENPWTWVRMPLYGRGVIERTPCLPPTALFLDLVDTILSFSSGQKDLWRRVFDLHAEAIAEAAPQLSLQELAAAIDGRVAPRYWADAERAARGRLELFRARREVLRLGLREVHCELPERLVMAVADTYTRTKESEVAPLGDAIGTVEAFGAMGCRLALVTNGSSAFQRSKLRRYGLEALFEVVLVEGEWGVGKPDVSIFNEALRRMDLSAESVWMVGDNYDADIRGAAAAEIAGVWVRNGRTLPRGSVGPVHVIDHISELIPLLDASTRRGSLS